jgi:glycosyltransferase involved in cell wall biosynthesis
LKALILYTELAGYTVSSLNLAIEHSDIEEIHVVRFPVNPEAPFHFKFNEGIYDYTVSDLGVKELEELADKINPDVILCSGWVNKDYLNICRKYYNKIPTVLTMDNRWNGTAKQRVLRLVSKFTLLNKFSHCWVPGLPQKNYAEILGFGADKIATGFYSADLAHFNTIFDKSISSKTADFPKKFICVARYIPVKGLEEMWNAFIQLKTENKTDWELWCLGTGDDYENRIQHEGIKHFGFVQPADIESYIIRTGVFILPSKFEPWGVSVHEFAASGFPLILSSEVGSSGSFLQENKNGYNVEGGNQSSIYAAMKKIISLSEEELSSMAKLSHELAQNMTQELWVQQLLSFKL